MDIDEALDGMLLIKHHIHQGDHEASLSIELNLLRSFVAHISKNPSQTRNNQDLANALIHTQKLQTVKCPF